MFGLRLSARITITAVALVVAGAMALMFIEEARLRDVYLSEQRASLERNLHTEKLQLGHAINNLRQDALFLSNTPPISGIVRAALNRGYDARDSDTREKWEARLQQIFSAFLAAHPNYFQARFIGVADGGREIVRVDNRVGKPEITPRSGLQAKGDMDYFKATLGLRAGEVSLSEFSFNRELGVIGQPHQPSLRASTPVFTPSGQVFGMVVVNMDAGHLLASAASGLPAGVQAYIANMSGEYLLHPDARRSFGFELGSKDNIATDFPFLQTMFKPQASEHLPLQAVMTTAGVQYMAAERIHFDPANPARFMTLAYYLPDGLAMPTFLRIPATHIIGGFIAMLLIGGIALLVLRRTFAPLEQISAAADKIAAGDHDIQLPQNGSGEIGSLINALNAMLTKLSQREQEVRQANTVLEERVKERTRELCESEERLKEAQRIAHVGSWQLDVATNHVVWTEELYRMLGMDPALPPPDYTEHGRLFTSESWERLSTTLSITRATGVPYELELEMLRPDGSHGWMRVRGEALRDANGSIVALQGVAEDITERRRIEEALRIAAAAIETQDAIMITDADANIIRVNQAFSVITGYSPEEVLGKNLGMMNSGQGDQDSCIEMLQQSIRDDLWTGEIWDKRKNGQIYPKWMTVTAVKNERHETTHYVTIFSDITARKQIEKENLRESDLRFRGTLEQAAVGIAHATLDGHFRQINQKFCSIVGYARDELLQMSYQDITFPADLDENFYFKQQLLAGKISTFSMEKRYVRKDRSLVWVNLTVSMLRDAGGTPKYTIGVIEDITGRKQSEAMLQQFGSFLQGSFNEIYLFDAHSLHFLLTSEGAEKNLGYSDDELNQLTPLDLNPMFTRESFERLVAPLRSGAQQLLSFETVHRRKNGTTYPVEARLQFMWGESPVFLAIVQDITERVQAEMELNQSRQLLRDLIAQREMLREEERKGIAREVHDELGQLLTALRMAVSLLRAEFGGRDAALLEGLQRVTDLLDRSIQCARDVVANLRPVALDMGIVPAISWLCKEFTKHTGTPCVLSVPEEKINLDEPVAMGVFRVVQESLTNVARYAEASKVEITLGQDADNFSVTVNDNGKGFDYLAISNRKTFGLLGMRERAIALGGAVNVYSAPQQGTQIFFVVSNRPTITDTKGNNP